MTRGDKLGRLSCHTGYLWLGPENGARSLVTGVLSPGTFGTAAELVSVSDSRFCRVLHGFSVCVDVIILSLPGFEAARKVYVAVTHVIVGLPGCWRDANFGAPHMPRSSVVPTHAGIRLQGFPQRRPQPRLANLHYRCTKRGHMRAFALWQPYGKVSFISSIRTSESQLFHSPVRASSSPQVHRNPRPCDPSSPLWRSSASSSSSWLSSVMKRPHAQRLHHDHWR